MTLMPIPQHELWPASAARAALAGALQQQWPRRVLIAQAPERVLERPLPRPTLVPYLLIVQQGSIQVRDEVGTHGLGVGDAVFFPPRTLVDIQVRTGCVLLRATWDEDLCLLGIQETHGRGLAQLSALRLAGAMNNLERSLCVRLEPHCAAVQARCYVAALCAALVERLQDPQEARTASRQRWKAVEAYMRRTCSLDIDRDRVAAAVGIHPNHLSRLISQHTGVGFLAWRTRLRLENAAARLQQSTASCAAIARDCGFVSVSHFTQAFRAHYGHTPARWRMQGRSASV